MTAEDNSPNLGLQPCKCLVTPGGRRSRVLSLLDTRCALESLGRQQEPPSFPDEDPHPSPNKTLTSATPSSKQCLHHQLLREGSLGGFCFCQSVHASKEIIQIFSPEESSCATCCYCLCTMVLIHKQSQ